MSYSIISILALIINLIINWEFLKKIQGSSGNKDEQESISRYRYFLIASNCYFITDIAWGLLYEYHYIEAIFPV